MIFIPALLICGYKKYSYLLSMSIHLQYAFSIRCRFYSQIPASTNFFKISSVHRIFSANTETKMCENISVLVVVVVVNFKRRVGYYEK